MTEAKAEHPTRVLQEFTVQIAREVEARKNISQDNAQVSSKEQK